MTWIHRTLVCPAHLVDAARELCAAVHPAGAGMFSAPASPDGALPATHWVTAGLVEDTWAPAFLAPEYLFGAAQAGAAEQGLTLTATLADAQALLAQGDISDEPWDLVSVRMGLVLCADPLM